MTSIHGAALKLKVVDSSINLTRVNLARDENASILLDHFVTQTVLAGAESVSKFMAATYLSQFEDLSCEFAKNPVFSPDFHIGYVPYSSELINLLNDVHRRGFIYLQRSKAELTAGWRSQTDWDIEKLFLLKNGAQLARLYLANEKNLHLDSLFDKVQECYSRDQKLSGMLAYSRSPKDKVY